MPKARLWAAGLLLALGATGATGQLVSPTPLKPPQPKLSLPQVSAGDLARSLHAPLATKPVDGMVAPLVTRSLQQSLQQTPRLTSTVLAAPLQLTRPLLSQPLLAPLLAHTDAALNRVSPVGSAVPQLSGAAMISSRSERLDGLVTAAPLLVDRDGAGQLIIRGRILLVDPSAETLVQAARSGFSIVDRHKDTSLGLTVVALAVPRGMSTIHAIQRLRAAAPQATADFDHLYEPAGGALAPSMAGAAAPKAPAGPLVGMIDGGVAEHPSLIGRVTEQRGFAGPARPTGHGTAVASLLVGEDGAFRSPGRGASLLVADVYGGNSSAGSASRIVQALGWLASRRPRVINISLVGPQNALLKRAVEAVRAKGIPVVAAVGNDGPAAPPQYPASYPSVVAVTAVDPRGVALFESGNAIDLDFAAPGAELAAARPGRGYARVRGTSFAAALAAGRLAMVGSPQRLAAEARPGKGRVGRGIVCFTCRISPAAVRAN